MKKEVTISKPQSNKFKEAAHDLETDNDEKRFDDTLGKISTHGESPETSMHICAI